MTERGVSLRTFALHAAVVAALLAANFVLPEYHRGVVSRVLVLAVFAMGMGLLQVLWSGHWRPWLLSGSALLYLGYTLFLYMHGS